MSMTGHQAITQQAHPVTTSLKAKTVEVEPPAFVEQEDFLAVVAALGDVMRDAVRHHPCLAGHEVSDSSPHKSRLSRLSPPVSPRLSPKVFLSAERITYPS
jgi:hypothetical protein